MILADDGIKLPIANTGSVINNLRPFLDSPSFRYSTSVIRVSIAFALLASASTQVFIEISTQLLISPYVLVDPLMTDANLMV